MSSSIQILRTCRIQLNGMNDMYNLVPVVQSYLRRELIGRCIDGCYIISAVPVLKPEDIAMIRPICTMSGLSDFLHIDLTVALHGYKIAAGAVLLGGTVTKKLDETRQQVIVSFKRAAPVASNGSAADPITIRVLIEGVDPTATTGLAVRIVNAEYRAHTDEISCSGLLVKPTAGPIAIFQPSLLNDGLRSEALSLIREFRKRVSDPASQAACHAYCIAACAPLDKLTFLKRTVDSKPIDVAHALEGKLDGKLEGKTKADPLYLDLNSLMLYHVQPATDARLQTLSFGAGPQIARPEQVDTDAMVILLIEHLRSMMSVP